MQKNRKAVIGWALYDFANSAFATTVMAGFFPVFFKQYWSFGADVNLSTARLGLGNSIASMIIALMAPLLGAIADKGSIKKKFLIFFAYMGAIMTASLYLVQKGDWILAVFIYSFAIIGFAGANIFYDSLLPAIAQKDEIDYVSGFGYGMGYLGGGLLFLVNVMMTLMPEKFGISDPTSAVKISFLSVALWWGFFTLFTILWVPEIRAAESGKTGFGFIRGGISQLSETFKKIRSQKNIYLFLLAYWFYIDGVDTIIRMAVDYGMSLGFDSKDLIVSLLIVQFVGFPAAIIFGKLGQTWGVRRSIFLSIGIYLFVVVWGTMMTKRMEFYVLAVVIGLSQGGIQALSRSYFSRLIPPDKTAEYFGFYNMLGKFAVIFGPALMGLTGLVVKNALMPSAPSIYEIEHIGQIASRAGIASVLILFIAGGILFYFVREEQN
ncbi:MAG: MFS transporter [Desulfobacteraceae bacterium]|nr:MAG: MFS transporter [Desulfobacteraceae bacterium]